MIRKQKLKKILLQQSKRIAKIACQNADQKKDKEQ
jgi:hypothetical protein